MRDDDDRTRRLVELLEAHQEQCAAYERSLPAEAYAARAAVLTLKEMIREAVTEAEDLASSATATEASPLTGREREILGLVAEGLANKQIAYRLHISERTVQFHLRSLFWKTEASSRTEVVTTALRRRWIRL